MQGWCEDYRLLGQEGHRCAQPTVGAVRGMSSGHSWHYGAVIPWVSMCCEGLQGWTTLEEETQMQTLLYTKPPRSKVGSVEGVPGTSLSPDDQMHSHHEQERTRQGKSGPLRRGPKKRDKESWSKGPSERIYSEGRGMRGAGFNMDPWQREAGSCGGLWRGNSPSCWHGLSPRYPQEEKATNAKWGQAPLNIQISLIPHTNTQAGPVAIPPSTDEDRRAESQSTQSYPACGWVS